MIYEAESGVGVAGKKAIEVLEKINYIRIKNTEYRSQNSVLRRAQDKKTGVSTETRRLAKLYSIFYLLYSVFFIYSLF